MCADLPCLAEAVSAAEREAEGSPRPREFRRCEILQPARVSAGSASEACSRADAAKLARQRPTLPGSRTGPAACRGLRFRLWLRGILQSMVCPHTRALVDHVANSETVIAGSFGTGARELVTCLAGLEELTFERTVLAP